MRLSDLLNSQVLDAQGARLGRVRDVRLTQDGPVLGEQRAAYSVAGLVVGTRGLGARLGIGRAGVSGPWILKAIFMRLHAGNRFVPWDCVASIEHERILLSASAAELGPVEPLP